MYNDQLVYTVVIWMFFGISLWKEKEALRPPTEEEIKYIFLKPPTNSYNYCATTVIVCLYWLDCLTFMGATHELRIYYWWVISLDNVSLWPLFSPVPVCSLWRGHFSSLCRYCLDGLMGIIQECALGFHLQHHMVCMNYFCAFLWNCFWSPASLFGLWTGY